MIILDYMVEQRIHVGTEHAGVILSERSESKYPAPVILRRSRRISKPGYLNLPVIGC